MRRSWSSRSRAGGNTANNTEHGTARRRAPRPCPPHRAAEDEPASRPAITAPGSLGRGGRLLGGGGRGGRVLGGGGRGAVEQRRGGSQHILGELPLRREQLLGEVVGARDQLARFGQLVGERDVHIGQRRLDGLDGVRPHLDRVDHGFLALADGLQNLALKLLPDRLGVAHGSSIEVSFCKLKYATVRGLSSGTLIYLALPGRRRASEGW